MTWTELGFVGHCYICLRDTRNGLEQQTSLTIIPCCVRCQQTYDLGLEVVVPEAKPTPKIEAEPYRWFPAYGYGHPP